jgi:FdhD protein
MTESQVNPTVASQQWPIYRVYREKQEYIDDRVVLEEPLEIVVNGQSIAILMRMPGNEKELAVGFSITEGHVRQVADILLIHHCGLGHPSPLQAEDDRLGSRNRVEMRTRPEGFVQPDHPDVLPLIRSGCGAAAVGPLVDHLPQVHGDLEISASTMLDLARAMRKSQHVHKQVGGTHAAGIFDRHGDLVRIDEDIGRHNAIDKAIGHCLLRDMPLDDKILVTSGRASYEMAIKAIRTGLPIIASMSAPTALAVQLAAEAGLTLIGYLRGGRMNVYTHQQRIE